MENKYIYILIGVVVLIAIIAVLLVVKKNKKKNVDGRKQRTDITLSDT